MNIVLISTYELGHQPFGLASPTAWLKAAGATVVCLDLAVQPLAPQAIGAAQLIAIYVPMHTATRLATPLIRQLRAINPDVHICCYGLYAPVNESFLRTLGVSSILGGEFESGLVALYRRLAGDGAYQPPTAQQEPITSLARQTFITPDRSGLPDLSAYAWVQLADGSQRVAGYTEASRGCKHLCRHCPIVPVYGGRFRIVSRDVVLDDIRQQVAAGARHVTFGDPDFFNGPSHALAIVKALHKAFPTLTYDVTIKIEHLLKHAQALPILRDTGCLFITSAVEAVDETILTVFDKRHTRADFIRAVALCRSAGLALNPTFVTFTPWTAREGYIDLLRLLADLDLIDNIAPIQYAIRLLIPADSKLLELAQVRALVGAFDEAALCYHWSHPDPRMDRLHADVLRAVQAGLAQHEPRRAIFEQVWRLAHEALEPPAHPRPAAGMSGYQLSRAPIPHLSEPWYC